MKYLKCFEDFAQVGVAPAGNVQGMGNPAPPTSTSTGSGDAWPSLGAPSSLAPLSKTKKEKKKKKKFNKHEKHVLKNPLQQESEATGFTKWLLENQ